MAERPAPPESPQLRTLFPQFWRLDSMARGELTGVDDAALDWTSERYDWAGWSMRQQASHMASLVYRWLCVRWGETLFPGGAPVSEAELLKLNSPEHDRRLDDRVYHDIEDILGAMDSAVELARTVLKERTVAEGRSLVMPRAATGQWAMMAKAHPHGITVNPDGSGSMTLEATFRHMYFEHMTHLFNIHRTKRALGLPVIVRAPDEGYHTIPGWDRSEAEPVSESY